MKAFHHQALDGPLGGRRRGFLLGRGTRLFGLRESAPGGQHQKNQQLVHIFDGRRTGLTVDYRLAGEIVGRPPLRPALGHGGQTVNEHTNCIRTQSTRLARCGYNSHGDRCGRNWRIRYRCTKHPAAGDPPGRDENAEIKSLKIRDLTVTGPLALPPIPSRER